MNKWKFKLKAGCIILSLFWNCSFGQNLEDLKKKYAPDLRTAVFESSLAQDTLILKTTENILMEEISLFHNGPVRIINLPFSETNSLGIINVSVANLRTQPKHSAELASQLLLGMPVKILERVGGWYRVQGPDKYIGFVESSSVVLKTWMNEKLVVVSSPLSFAYSQKNRKSEVVADLTWGNLLREVKKKGKFTRVIFPDGRNAFIPSKDILSLEQLSELESSKAEEIVADAKKMMGIPYLWGGTSWRGVDCSGFTRMVYLMNGAFLPRDASQQALLGKQIDTTNGFDLVQPGDLLFFGAEKVTHVALSLGKEQFIHASGMVRINSLRPDESNYDAFNASRLLFIKRMWGDPHLSKLNNSTFY